MRFWTVFHDFCTKIEKILKKSVEKFGDIKIMPTFAIPFEKTV